MQIIFWICIWAAVGVTVFGLVPMFIVFIEKYKDIKERELYKKPPAPIVKCEDCKCCISQSDVYEVKARNTLTWGEYTEYFCHKCQPPYTRVWYSRNGVRYYKEFEVDINGKLIK